MPDELPVLRFADRDAWARWLEANGTAARGVWIKVAKKHSGIASVTCPEALEVSLCHGWIDGQRKGLDETWFLQKYTPRRARSRWSQRNREAAEALIASGAMRPAGLAEVERARADGRWDAAYGGRATIEVPDDLLRALDAEPGARAHFDALDGASRFTILYRIHDAKRPETRARRIAGFVARCAAGEPIS